MVTEDSKAIADTIVQQLGGFGKLRAMVGAERFSHRDGELTFVFKGNRKLNVCRIKLNGRDLYDVEFLLMRKLSLTRVSEHNDISCDQLKGLFECETGLLLSLF